MSASSSSKPSASSKTKDFPKTPAEFEKDVRVAFSSAESKWILEDDDGAEWEYKEIDQTWVPAVPLEDVDEATTNTAAPQDIPARPHKRSAYDDTPQDDLPPHKAKKQKPAKKEREPPVNTAVYVTSLPLDVTVEEVNDTFKRFGIIAEEVDSGKPRIKLYTNEAGEFKGDALIVYFKRESVGLAINMLDETDFRFGEGGPGGKMRVTEADRSYKKQQGQPKDDNADGKKKGPSKDQKKIMKKTQKLNDRLADWSDDDTAALKQTSSRFDKVVVLKHMFTLKELEEDPANLLEIKEDIRAECEKIGQVTNVSLFDKEEDGIVTVRFGTPEAANACVKWIAGRKFSEREVVAYIADGSERFKRSSAKKSAKDEEDESDEEERIEKFGEFLEGKPT